MTDAPKHPIDPDPANELASDHSPIDPRDFRNALGTFATGVTIITAAAADGKPYGLTCNSVRVGVAEPAARTLEPGDLFSGHERIPGRQPFHGQCPWCIAASRLRADSQNLPRTNLPEFNGRLALATRRFLRTALQTFNAAPPIDIMAATM